MAKCSPQRSFVVFAAIGVALTVMVRERDAASQTQPVDAPRPQAVAARVAELEQRVRQLEERLADLERVRVKPRPDGGYDVTVAVSFVIGRDGAVVSPASSADQGAGAVHAPESACDPPF